MLHLCIINYEINKIKIMNTYKNQLEAESQPSCLGAVIASASYQITNKMKKPFKYTIICNKTKKVVMKTNKEPLLHELQTLEETSDPNVRELKQTKTAYIDTRYEAKLRLYNYVNYTKNGLEIPRYRPFAGTEIGKTIPILNF